MEKYNYKAVLKNQIHEEVIDIFDLVETYGNLCCSLYDKIYCMDNIKLSKYPDKLFTIQCYSLIDEIFLEENTTHEKVYFLDLTKKQAKNILEQICEKINNM